MEGEAVKKTLGAFEDALAQAAMSPVWGDVFLCIGGLLLVLALLRIGENNSATLVLAGALLFAVGYRWKDISVNLGPAWVRDAKATLRSAEMSVRSNLHACEARASARHEDEAPCRTREKEAMMIIAKVRDELPGMPEYERAEALTRAVDEATRP